MVRAPLHFHGRIPVPEVAPLTYRDGVSQLELVYELSQYLKNILHPSLQSTVDQVVADTEQLLDEANDQYVDGVEEFQRIHDRFMSDVNASLMALNDSAVSDLVEDATSLLGQILRRTFEPHGEVHRQVSEKMGVVTPDELTFEKLQSAADEAYETGKRLWAAGELDTAETLVIRCDADLGGLTINYTGGDVAVVIGDRSTILQNTVGTTPRVLNPGRVWDKNTIGIQFMNVYSGVWNIPLVDGFAVGMDVVGDGRGNVYNTFTIGHLLGNRINQRLRGINDGWSNQNTYIGGRYSHLSAQGTRTPGSRHIEMTKSSHGINNNMWLNPSVEGGVSEYAIYFTGSYNIVMNGRFEGSPRARVYWDESAVYNHIFMGYQAQFLIEEPETANSTNSITSTNMLRLTGGTSYGNLRIRNSSSAGAPGYVLHGIHSSIENVDGYSVWQGQRETRMKGTDDAHPRLMFNHETGRIYFGVGTENPTRYIGNYGDRFNFQGMNTTDTNPRSGNTGLNDLPTTPQGYLEVTVDGSRAFIPYFRP